MCYKMSSPPGMHGGAKIWMYLLTIYHDAQPVRHRCRLANAASLQSLANAQLI